VKEVLNTEKLLQSRRYDPARKMQPEQILLRIDNQNIGSIQNVVTISGLPKQGKSRYIGAMVASALTREEIFNIRVKTPEGRNEVALFDTEQGEYDFYKQMDHIKALAGGNLPDYFFAYNTREDFPKQQLMLIDKFLELHPKCSIVFLDGILDLLDSFNDERESMRLMRLIKKWTKEKNVLIVTVLHRRKDGTATLGHIGSAVDRVSQSVLTVEKSKERNTYILKPEYLRSAEDFTPIEIYYNRQETAWQQTFYTPDEPDKVVRMKKPKPGELSIEDHRTAVMRIFNVQPYQKYSELKQNICEMYASTINWAQDCIPYLISQGLIYKTVDGYTNVKQAKLYIKSGA
jgi:hypothetical protein